jgi:hypothetical protein
LELLAEVDLGRAQALFAVDGAPTGSGVTAVEEFLIDTFVATAAVACSEVSTDHKAVMVFFLLALCGLVAVKAGYALSGMGAHFVFMDYGILKTGVAFGALATGSDKVGD